MDIRTIVRNWRWLVYCWLHHLSCAELSIQIWMLVPYALYTWSMGRAFYLYICVYACMHVCMCLLEIKGTWVYICAYMSLISDIVCTLYVNKCVAVKPSKCVYVCVYMCLCTYIHTMWHLFAQNVNHMYTESNLYQFVCTQTDSYTT